MAEQENNLPHDMNLSDFSKEQHEKNEHGDENDTSHEEGSEEHKEGEPSEKKHDSAISPERERDAINEVPVEITVVVGRRRMPVRDLIKLGRGAVVTLDRKLGSPIDIYANDRLIARGEITIVEDDNIAVTMTEIMSANSGT